MMPGIPEPPACSQPELAPLQIAASSLHGRPATSHASPALHPPPSLPSSTSTDETSSPSGMPSITPPPAPASYQPRHKVIIREPNGTLLQFDNFQSDGRPTRVPRTGLSLSPAEQDFAESLAREERERLKDKKTKAKKGRKKGQGQGLQAQEEAKRKQAEKAKALKEDQGFQRAKCEETVCVAEASRREEGVQERKVERKESAEATSPKDEVEVTPVNAALANARAIGDITSVRYPEGIICPPAEINIRTTGGRFIYDRAFLLQFKDVCRERPVPGRTSSAEVLDYLDNRPEGAERRHAARIKAIQMRSPRAPAFSTSSAAPAGSKPSPAPSRA